MKIVEPDMKARLCYVEGNTAYFTTQAISKQTGDDWNDAPYDCNAGEPYEPGYYYYTDERGAIKNERDWNKDGSPKWQIYKIMFEANLEEPKYVSYNCPFSVDDINKKKFAWLTDRYGSSNVLIFAGCRVKEFIELIYKAGGKVYMEVSND